MANDLTGRRILRTCDACKARKVKCSGQPAPCESCVRRNVDCHFSRMRPPRRPNTNPDLAYNGLPDIKPEKELKSDSGSSKPLPELYIDRLLSQARPEQALKQDRLFSVKTPGLFVGNYSLTFFSDNRLQYLSKHLRNDRVTDLVQRISAVISSRLALRDPATAGSFFGSASQGDSYPRDPSVPVWNAKTYIQLYFDRIHPIYPFLDQSSFESTAFSPNLPQLLSQNIAWSTLYYTVLALGCQFHGGGSFESGKGEAWKLFSIPLSNFPELMTLPDSLTVLQAMAAMSVYSLGISCLTFEHAIMSEAARRAQNLSKFTLTDSTAVSYHAAFWVIYCVEKVSSFHFGRHSSFVDHDIIIPIPTIPNTTLDGLFLVGVRYGRLLSRAMSSLFSASPPGNPKTYYLATIDQLSEELERWRESIPESLRPGKPLSQHESQLGRLAALYAHYMYNSFRLSLCRATMHLARGGTDIVSASRQAESTATMLQMSRSSLELTSFIDVGPHTPLWILCGIPLTALFVLFDRVIGYPRDQETVRHLALLEIGGGHFSRIEYASNGSLPACLVAEFAHIARDYINTVNRSGVSRPDPPPLQEASGPGHVVPLTSAKFPDPKTDSDASMVVDPPAWQPQLPTTNIATQPGISSADAVPLSVDPFYFMSGENLSGNDDGLGIGTNIMDLFNTTVAGIDPILFDQTAGDQTFVSTEP